MRPSIRNMDRLVLTPIFWSFNVAALSFLINGWWLWLAGAVAGSFYVGIIGAKIHPLQSLSELARGSLKNPKAKDEDAMPPEEQRFLVSHACTRLGILIGAIVLVILWARLGWRGDSSAGVGFLCMLFSGALFKVAL